MLHCCASQRRAVVLLNVASMQVHHRDVDAVLYLYSLQFVSDKKRMKLSMINE